jgi:hypothetical protein
LATPYAPSQLSLGNFDATQAATATWVFSSPDNSVIQKSFQIRIYNNDTGTLVLDTGVINSNLSQYTIPANTLVNRTTYKWQVQYTDSAGNTSPWSSFSVFTCSSLPTTSIVTPTLGQTISGNTLVVTCSYAQAQSVPEQSWRIVIYSDDQMTVVQDTGVQYSTTNQYTFYGLTNGMYYVESTVTSTDGLSTASGKIQFVVDYAGSPSTSNITAIPLPQIAAIRIDWDNNRDIPGTYVPSSGSPTFIQGMFDQAIQISKYGEKVYWVFNEISQFTYTSWVIPMDDSTLWTTERVFVHLCYDPQNYLQLRYDPSDSTFVFEKTINGKTVTAKSQSGLTFTASDHIFIAIQQSSSSTRAYIGLHGNWYSISPQILPSRPSEYGVDTYGVGQYASSNTGLIAIQYAYVGCSPTDGFEAHSSFDQTHLTLDIWPESTLQSLYTNETLQEFSTQTIFLANFDGNLIGGLADMANIVSWNIYRIANGVRYLVDNIPYNPSLPTASYIDYTPRRNVNYTYEISAVDENGNVGQAQTVTASVDFQGWWLTDPKTGTSFHLYFNIDDASIKTNYQRAQYDTFGTYPVVAYSPQRYRGGQVSGWILDWNGSGSPYEQYQTLQALIDSHTPLVLRNDEGWGFIVDCYDQTNTIPHRNHRQYNQVQFSWVEVDNLV